MKEGGLGDVKFTLVSYLPRYPTDLVLQARGISAVCGPILEPHLPREGELTTPFCYIVYRKGMPKAVYIDSSRQGELVYLHGADAVRCTCTLPKRWLPRNERIWGPPPSIGSSVLPLQ